MTVVRRPLQSMVCSGRLTICDQKTSVCRASYTSLADDLIQLAVPVVGLLDFTKSMHTHRTDVGVHPVNRTNRHPSSSPSHRDDSRALGIAVRELKNGAFVPTGQELRLLRIRRSYDLYSL